MYINNNVVAIIIGYFAPIYLAYHGMLVGEKGIDYYSEVHTSKMNSYIHTVYMPLTIYGMFLWIPQVFNTSFNNAINIQTFLYYMFMTHYISINWKMGLLISIYYAIPRYIAYETYIVYSNLKRDVFRNKMIKAGLVCSIIALLIQEFFGHYLSGDQSSRLIAIPNAIMYAMYYSVSHIFT
jgi:hypothetical protein